MHIRQRNSRSVTVRELVVGDYRYITALERSYGLETRSYEEWIHLWDANPAYKEVATTWPRGWVLENEDKQVVGSLGNIPLWYEFEGQRVIAATGHAWVVDLPYRKYSMLLLDRCFKQQNADLLLNTSSNRNSSGIFGSFNSRVPMGAWDQSIFWITDYPGFVASWAVMKAKSFVRPSNYALSGGFLLRTLSAKNGLARPYQRSDVEFNETFDERFDAFWQALRKQKLRSFLAVRNREVLDWHFKYALMRKEIWILTIADRSGLVAYAIFGQQDNPKYGLRRMRLIDFQALNGNTRLLLPMLRYALARCRDHRIHMLEYIGVGPEVSGIVVGLRPYHRTLPSWLYYYTPLNQELASHLANPQVWSPSSFDGDLSL